MKKVLAFLVLLSHMNTSMFLPQTPELDAFDRNGKKIDDVNSVLEYIGVLAGLDNVADDEDDDTGQTFHITKTTVYDLSQPVSIRVQEKKTQDHNAGQFVEHKAEKIKAISFDIITPPPEALRIV
ncbi:MAG TPA: hypothetical protein VHC48_14975 [Puia sp.]|nr:hypothetical protein [Puia sp.]